MSLKKILIPLVVVVLLSSFWLFTDSSPPAEIHECDNIYSSGVYTDFCHQFVSYVEQNKPSLSLQPAEFTEFIDLVARPEKENLRKYHALWVSKLRNLPFDQFPHKIQQFILELSSWLITSPELRQSTVNFLFEKFPSPKEREDYAKFIQTYYKNFIGIPSISYKAPTYDDGFLYGNLSYYLFSLDNAKRTKVLRMANTAKDLPLIKSLFLPSKYQVHEEFYHHIEQLGEELHLYINLMKRSGKESRKSKQLENFESTQPSLILISLDKNSPFYWQKGDFASINDAETFKGIFHTLLFKKRGSYYWSQKLNQKEWQKTCQEMIEKIHQNYFDSHPTLTILERKDFIELCYLKITESLVQKFDPAYLNITCKHSMDRGPSLTTLLYIAQLLKKEKVSSEEQDLALNMLFSPPWLIHNRSSHGSRIDRLTSALQRIQTQY